MKLSDDEKTSHVCCGTIVGGDHGSFVFLRTLSDPFMLPPLRSSKADTGKLGFTVLTTSTGKFRESVSGNKRKMLPIIGEIKSSQESPTFEAFVA